uniref:Myb-like domain-containing protein n=1 Tax=Brassica oleracea var. oleracea TaxID=109376 RepID=A0A0D3C5V5_BRAOL
MEFNPFIEPSNFVELLSSQQSVSLSEAQVPFYGTQSTEPSNFGEDNQASRKERRTWSPGDDVLLISSWLNTSKDAIVGNEQRLNAFWKRIVVYYNASPSVGGCEKREPAHCKNRWQKINDQVCKFCGAYEAANREKTSGQNENDVLKLAHQIFFTNHNKKFTLEHAWKELRSKKRKCGYVSHSASSKATEVDSGDDDEAITRPPGVKAAKARSKKTMSDGKELSEFQTIMNKPLFMKIVDRLSNEMEFFRQKPDGLGRQGLSALQKLLPSIVSKVYNLTKFSKADAVDEYLRLGETTIRSCVEHFVEGIIYLFGDEYLRRPTPADLQRLLDIGEFRGFPGMIGSIDCMHWEWKNCPTAWKGQYSRGPKAALFAKHQEAVRKDVERVFGVLQARFAIVKNPALFWDKAQTGKIMRACIILHNMIVEDERDGYTQFDVSGFQQGEETGSSHVNLDFSSNMPTNLVNMIGVRTRIRDRSMHEQLKADLVEHLWSKFGEDVDNS